MSANESERLAVELIEERFGPVVGRVARTLFRFGPSTLGPLTKRARTLESAAEGQGEDDDRMQLTGPVTGAQVRDALVVLIHHNLVVPEAKLSTQDSFAELQQVAQSHCTYRLCHRRTLMLMRHARFVATADEIFGRRGAWLVEELLIYGRSTAENLLEQTALRVTAGANSIVAEEFSNEIIQSPRCAAINDILAHEDEEEEEDEEEGTEQLQEDANAAKIKAIKSSPVFPLVKKALGLVLDRLVVSHAVDQVRMFGAKTVSDGIATGEEEFDLAEANKNGKVKTEKKETKRKRTAAEQAKEDKKKKKKVKGEKAADAAVNGGAFGGAKESARKVDGRQGPRELEMSVELQLLMGGGGGEDGDGKKKKTKKTEKKSKKGRKRGVDSDDDDSDDDDDDGTVNAAAVAEKERKRKADEAAIQSAANAKRARLDAGNKTWWRISFRFFMQEMRADKLAMYAREKTGVPQAADIIDLCCASTRLTTISRRYQNDQVDADFLLPDSSDTASTATLLDDHSAGAARLRESLGPKFVQTIHVLVTVMCSPRIDILGRESEGNVREGKRFPTVNVNFRAVIDILRRECVLDIAASRYGPKAARVMRLLQAKGQLEQKEVGDLAMLPPRDARAALYMLLKGGMLKLHEISKRPDMAPTNTFFMWSVDMEGACKQLAAYVCRALVNLRLRRRAILSHNHSLVQSFQHLDIEAAADAATSGEVASGGGSKGGAVVSEVDTAAVDPDATKSVEGLKRYHRMRHALEKLDAQMLRFDDTYMVLCEL